MNPVGEPFDVAVVGLGALGSATAWQLSRRGRTVLGLERFDLGHDRGASHGDSRIIRMSYHTPGYVSAAIEAYQDWALLEADCRRPLVLRCGGVDLFPPMAAIDIEPRADAIEHRCNVLAHRRIVRATASEPDFLWPRKQAGILTAQPLHHPFGKSSLQQFHQGVDPARTVGAKRLPAGRAHVSDADLDLIDLRPADNRRYLAGCDL